MKLTPLDDMLSLILYTVLYFSELRGNVRVIFWLAFQSCQHTSCFVVTIAYDQPSKYVSSRTGNEDVNLTVETLVAREP